MAQDWWNAESLQRDVSATSTAGAMSYDTQVRDWLSQGLTSEQILAATVAQTDSDRGPFAEMAKQAADAAIKQTARIIAMEQAKESAEGDGTAMGTWVATGASDMCDGCASLNGKEMTLDEFMATFGTNDCGFRCLCFWVKGEHQVEPGPQPEPAPEPEPVTPEEEPPPVVEPQPKEPPPAPAPAPAPDTEVVPQPWEKTPAQEAESRRKSQERYDKMQAKKAAAEPERQKRIAAAEKTVATVNDIGRKIAKGEVSQLEGFEAIKEEMTLPKARQTSAAALQKAIDKGVKKLGELTPAQQTLAGQVKEQMERFSKWIDKTHQPMLEKSFANLKLTPGEKWSHHTVSNAKGVPEISLSSKSATFHEMVHGCQATYRDGGSAAEKRVRLKFLDKTTSDHVTLANPKDKIEDQYYTRNVIKDKWPKDMEQYGARSYSQSRLQDGTLLDDPTHRYAGVEVTTVAAEDLMSLFGAKTASQFPELVELVTKTLHGGW